MAKKAKKTKKAKRAKKAAKVRAATGRTSKTGAASRNGASVPAESVVQFVKMLVQEGHTAAFEASAKAAGVKVTLNAKGVKFVRRFIRDNAHLRGPMSLSIQDPCPGNPFEC